MPDQNENIINSEGICTICGGLIKEGEDTVTYRGKTIHAKCQPSKEAEQAANRSNT